MSYELLSEPIRKYIRDKRWSQLRPIQAAAISKIMQTECHYILASRTASGKTEAAFLPILSKINFDKPGIAVLYISPLIALINDQFDRIEELADALDISVTKWHGEAGVSAKNKILRQPNGIILITPESLEAMFVNKPYNVRKLFSNVDYVVVDEIHSFLGTDRGTHLKSILSRLQQLNIQPFKIIGLSATIGDYDQAKKFTGDAQNTVVLLDRTSNEMEVQFRYFPNKNEEIPTTLIENLYTETKDNKVLIFPNSRGRVEEIAVKLKKISQLLGGFSHYFSHHSSVDKEMREYVEFFAKNSIQHNFCIVCTSTLELGIDIGSVDEIVQIDATHSVASLIQRVGRSGRLDGQKSRLVLYSTKPWSLLQSLACWLLYCDGFIEPPQPNDRPYDILLHQALSIAKGVSGITPNELIRQLKENFAFSEIEVKEMIEILEHLVSMDYLEKIGNELIIGLEGEKIVNGRDFYSVFKTEKNFKVVHAGNTIGEIPFSPQIVEDENILLGARIWKIRNIELKSKKIEVIPAVDGKKPVFFGGGAVVHPRVREKMMEILFEVRQYDVLDDICNDEIMKLRKEFSVYPIQEIQKGRPLLTREVHLHFYSFIGTKINRTLLLLLNSVGMKSILNENSSEFEIIASTKELFAQWDTLSIALTEIDAHIERQIVAVPTLLGFSKWGAFLPTKYQVKLLRDSYYDMEGAAEFLGRVRLVGNL